MCYGFCVWKKLGWTGGAVVKGEKKWVEDGGPTGELDLGG